MDASNLGRRDFHRLSLAALGGALAGASLASCKSKEHDAMAEVESGVHPLLSEPHVCRGLNTCEGKGAGGGNKCAGMGKCATAKSHSCHGMNDCKGRGGCGGKAGMNECAGKGGCAVPLKAEAWAKVRPAFEEAAKAANMKVGAAPQL
jgi:hypothetical protein